MINLVELKVKQKVFNNFKFCQSEDLEIGCPQYLTHMNGAWCTTFNEHLHRDQVNDKQLCKCEECVKEFKRQHEPRCTCHERDNTYSCDFCRSEQEEKSDV